MVDLEQSTIETNARFFDKIEDVPTQAYSMEFGIFSMQNLLFIAQQLLQKLKRLQGDRRDRLQKNCLEVLFKNMKMWLLSLNEKP